MEMLVNSRAGTSQTSQASSRESKQKLQSSHLQEALLSLPATGALYAASSASLSSALLNAPPTGALQSNSSAGSNASQPLSGMNAFNYLSSAVASQSPVDGVPTTGKEPTTTPVSLDAILAELTAKGNEFGSLLAWVKSADTTWKSKRNKDECLALAEAWDSIARGDLKRARDAIGRRLATVGIYNKYGKYGGIAVLEPSNSGDMFSQNLANGLLSCMVHTMKLEGQVTRASQPAEAFPRTRTTGRYSPYPGQYAQAAAQPQAPQLRRARGPGQNVRYGAYAPQTFQTATVQSAASKPVARGKPVSEKTPAPDQKQP